MYTEEQQKYGHFVTKSNPVRRESWHWR